MAFRRNSKPIYNPVLLDILGGGGLLIAVSINGVIVKCQPVCFSRVRHSANLFHDVVCPFANLSIVRSLLSQVKMKNLLPVGYQSSSM